MKQNHFWSLFFTTKEAWRLIVELTLRGGRSQVGGKVWLSRIPKGLFWKYKSMDEWCLFMESKAIQVKKEIIYFYLLKFKIGKKDSSSISLKKRKADEKTPFFYFQNFIINNFGCLKIYRVCLPQETLLSIEDFLLGERKLLPF